jgi:hypothetical protein
MGVIRGIDESSGLTELAIHPQPRLCATDFHLVPLKPHYLNNYPTTRFHAIWLLILTPLVAVIRARLKADRASNIGFHGHFYGT